MLLQELLLIDPSVIGPTVIGNVVLFQALAADLLAQEAPEGSLFTQILRNPMTPLVGLFLLFYFIFIVPERRRKSEEATMMSALKKNDRVVTIGGIHGTVVAAPSESDVVTLRIDENGNTRIKVNRSAIARVGSVKDGQDSSGKDSASDTKD